MKKHIIAILSVIIVLLTFAVIFMINLYVAPGHDGIYVFEALFIGIFTISMRFMFPLLRVSKPKAVKKDDSSEHKPDVKNSGGNNRNEPDNDDLQDFFEDFTSMWMT